MALAASSYEVRVVEILTASSVPLLAKTILKELKNQFNMTTLRKSDVNSTLYATSIYGSVPGSTPPLWFVRGSAADQASEEAKEPESSSQSPYSRLCDIPPLAVVPDGEFLSGTVVVGGESADAAVMTEVVNLLARKGAARLRCLVGQPAGEAALDASASVASIEAVVTKYQGDDFRRAIAVAHREVMAGPPAALCLVGPRTTSDYGVHHILAAFETRDLPVYLFVAGCAPSPARANG